jgi:acyl-coenzyme A synthetase/AMP-(fatty) acid ligase
MPEFADHPGQHAPGTSDTLPLWSPADMSRPIAWRDGLPVSLREFARDVGLIAQPLPRDAAMINLCEDRYHFVAAYAAALSRGHAVLLPPSRAEEVVREVAGANPGSYRCDDGDVLLALNAGNAGDGVPADIVADRAVMIGFTSGSTGQPKRFPKLWRSVNGSNACNAAAIRHALQIEADAPAWIVATVPPQHMYGMELSVLLPLIGGMAVHSGRPLFPADIAQALEEVPTPRVLVSTPLHLRAMVDSDQMFPPTNLIISATAPLDASLAARVEERLGGTLLEMFGATETCIFASRRTAIEASWQLYPEVTLQPQAEGTMVSAPWFAEPTLLQDVVELQPGDRFVVRGRNADMIEVAGKRASLADLTRRVLAIAGVRDAVVLQPDRDQVGAIRRVAALVVAPGLSSKQVQERMADSIDPAFMPRPLLIVDHLPRNEVGKLSREAVLQLLKR